MQNTEEWNELRLGRITCSQFDKLFMKENTKGFRRFIREKAFERLLNAPIPDKWGGNWATEQGHERESQGIKLYELETFQKVEPGGFWLYSDTVGGSPDGHISKDGLLEVKSRTTEVWLENIMGFEPSRAEYWQCMGQMLVSGRNWTDLLYTPPHESLKPLIYRIDRDEGAIQHLIDKLDHANDLISEEMNKLKNYII